MVLESEAASSGIVWCVLYRATRYGMRGTAEGETRLSANVSANNDLERVRRAMNGRHQDRWARERLTNGFKDSDDIGYPKGRTANTVGRKFRVNSNQKARTLPVHDGFISYHNLMEEELVKSR